MLYKFSNHEKKLVFNQIRVVIFWTLFEQEQEATMTLFRNWPLDGLNFFFSLSDFVTVSNEKTNETNFTAQTNSTWKMIEQKQKHFW